MGLCCAEEAPFSFLFRHVLPCPCKKKIKALGMLVLWQWQLIFFLTFSASASVSLADNRNLTATPLSTRKQPVALSARENECFFVIFDNLYSFKLHPQDTSLRTETTHKAVVHDIFCVYYHIPEGTDVHALVEAISSYVLAMPKNQMHTRECFLPCAHASF